MRWEGDMSGKKKLGFSPSVVFIPSEPSLHGGVWSTLSVQSKGHALYVFINGRFSGSACGTSENKQFSSMNLTERFSGSEWLLLSDLAYEQRVLHYERKQFEKVQGWMIQTMENVFSPPQDEYAPVIFLQHNVSVTPVKFLYGFEP